MHLCDTGQFLCPYMSFTYLVFLLLIFHIITCLELSTLVLLCLYTLIIVQCVCTVLCFLRVFSCQHKSLQQLSLWSCYLQAVNHVITFSFYLYLYLFEHINMFQSFKFIVGRESLIYLCCKHLLMSIPRAIKPI